MSPDHRTVPRRVPGQDGHPGAATGSGLVLLAALLWGTTGTAQALGPAGADPLAVGTTRLVAGGLLLVAWAMVDARRRPAPFVTPQPRTWAHLGVAGALGVAAYQLAFFAAVDRAGVGLGTAVAIGSAPAFTGLIEWGVARVRPSRAWGLSTLLAVVGVSILAGPSSAPLPGVALALGAGLSYAVYAVASKGLLDRGFPAPTAMAVVFGGGGLALLPLLAVVPLAWMAQPAGWTMLLWLAGPTILVAYLLYGAGLRTVSAANASTLSLAEPLTAAVLGVVVLAERPGATSVVGGALVLAGVVVVAVLPVSRTPFSSSERAPAGRSGR